MNKMDDKHRYHSYYQTKNCNNDDSNQQHEHPYQYSSSHYDNRLNKQNYLDFSDQRLERNQYEQSKSKTYSCFPAPPPPQPLMSAKIIPPPPTSLTAIPHERESWIRSVKKTKLNESTEQKTQYLETMLRMPQQQKSSMYSSTFDRMRFANDQTLITTNTTENNNNNNLDQSSFHLIGNINDHNDICAIEKYLFDNEPQLGIEQCSNQLLLSTLPSSSITCESTVQTNVEPLPCSGFLIDNCDEEEHPLISPPPPRLSIIEEPIQQNPDNLNKQGTMLVNELNVADVEQRQESRRQKRLRRRFQRKNKHSKQTKTKPTIEPETMSTVNNNDPQELLSDWIVEYDVPETNRISQLTCMAKEASKTMTDENKIAKVNVILKKIKRQQTELRKLRKYFMLMLGEEQKRNLTSTTQQNSHINQDLLLTFINQPILSGCWLCSGKSYTEVATQCDHVDE